MKCVRRRSIAVRFLLIVLATLVLGACGDDSSISRDSQSGSDDSRSDSPSDAGPGTEAKPDPVAFEAYESLTGKVRTCATDVKVTGAYEETWANNGITTGSDEELEPDRLYVSISPTGMVVELAMNLENGSPSYALTMRDPAASGGWLGDPPPRTEDFNQFDPEGSGANLQSHPLYDFTENYENPSSPINLSVIFDCP